MEVMIVMEEIIVLLIKDLQFQRIQIVGRCHLMDMQKFFININLE